MNIRSLKTFSGTCLAVLILLIASGCATKKVDWNARIGTYSYDQAVADFGPPDKQTMLSNGDRVAEWIHHSSGGVSFGVGVGSYGPGGGVGVGQSVGTGFPDKVMDLTFGPDGRLVQWSKNY